MFLTDAELRELTGYAYPCRQIDWLRRYNWKFEVTAQNRPKVARVYFDVRMGAPGKAIQEPSSSIMRPNFEAIQQIGR